MIGPPHIVAQLDNELTIKMVARILIEFFMRMCGSGKVNEKFMP